MNLPSILLRSIPAGHELQSSKLDVIDSSLRRKLLVSLQHQKNQHARGSGAFAYRRLITPSRTASLDLV